jgi:hypothetical protein
MAHDSFPLKGATKQMPHPFEFIPSSARKAFFILFLLLALACLALFQFVLDPPLRTALAPLGIVSFELAWTVDTVRAIIGSWDYATKVYASFGLGFDFLFMLVYAFALGLGTLMASNRMGRRFANTGKLLGWGVVLAALLDATENILLFTIMTKGNYPPYALFASLAATFKFLLLFVAIIFSLLGLLTPRQSRSRPAKKPAEQPPPSFPPPQD